MKKVLCLILAFAMVFCLAACGNKDDEEDNTPAYSKGLTDDGFYDLTALDYVELPEYEGLQFDDENFWGVSEETIDSEMQSLLEYAASTVELTDRAVEYGDNVNIDYEGKLDGVAFDGGTATGQDVVAGSESFVDNFLSKII